MKRHAHNSKGDQLQQNEDDNENEEEGIGEEEDEEALSHQREELDEEEFSNSHTSSSSSCVLTATSQLIAEVFVHDQIRFSAGDKNSLFFGGESVATDQNGSQSRHQLTVLTLEFEIPRAAIVTVLIRFCVEIIQMLIMPLYPHRTWFSHHLNPRLVEVISSASTQKVLAKMENRINSACSKQTRVRLMTINAIGLSKSFRVQFLCMSASVLDIAIKFEKNESMDLSEEASNFLKHLFGDQGNSSRLIQDEEMTQFFKICFDSIQIFGYPLNASPSANQSLSLLNVSHILRKSGRVSDAIECEIMLGLSMLSSRKYIQASEILKKCSMHFVELYRQENQMEISFQKMPTNGLKGVATDSQKLQKNKQSTDASGRSNASLTMPVIGSKRSSFVGAGGGNVHEQQQIIGTNNRHLLRAAKMELLVADSINHPSMILQKLQAYQRASEYFSNNWSWKDEVQSESGSGDVYSGLLVLCPFLCKFLLKTLADPFEPIKLASIRGIEFLIEYLGCTLANFLPTILTAILKTYPTSRDYSHSFSVDNDQYQMLQFDDSNSGLMMNGSGQPRYRSQAFTDSKGKQKSGSVTGDDNESVVTGNSNSASLKIVTDMYHQLLESFVNVLASASSQILRGIYFDVIVHYLFKQSLHPDLKIYCIRIAEKILAICQGDIHFSVDILGGTIKLLEEQNNKANGHANLKFHVNKLWDAMRFKYIYNLNPTEMNKLIQWISENLIALSENEELDNFSFLYHLLDITSVVCSKLNGQATAADGRSSIKKVEENDNVIMKFYKKLGQKKGVLLAQTIELVRINDLMEPLILWIHNALSHLTRLDLFRTIWLVLIDVLMAVYENSPTKLYKNGSVGEQDVTIADIALPLMQRIYEHIQSQQPNEKMLQFLTMVTNSLLLFPRQLDQHLNFFIEFFQSYLHCIPHSVHDETFFIFDNLCEIITPQNFQPKTVEVTINHSFSQGGRYQIKIKQKDDSFCPFILIKIVSGIFVFFFTNPFSDKKKQQSINMLLDQYTVKGKAHRKSKEQFISIVLKSKDSLRESLQCLLIQNREETLIRMRKKDSKLHSQMQDLFNEKLSLVSELFQQLNLENLSLIEELVINESLQNSFVALLTSGSSKNRQKGLSILKLLFERYIEICEYAAKPVVRLKRRDGSIIKLMLFCLKRGLENERDSKLQFNTLLILDQVFQHLFKGPSLDQEICLWQASILKSKSSPDSVNESNNSSDDPFQAILPNGEQHDDADSQTPQYIELHSCEYLRFRSREIMKLWTIMGVLIDSPWSNIRSIAYGIICYWVKDANSLHDIRFLAKVKRTLETLLGSKESECRTGGLNILGSLCGLGFNFDNLGIDKLNLQFFRRNSVLIPQNIWNLVYSMQFDWDQTNQAASVTLSQLCTPRDILKQLIQFSSGEGLAFIGEDSSCIEKAQSWRNITTADPMLSASWRGLQIEDYLKDEHVFWMEQLEEADIKELISMFRNEFKPPQTLWIERVNYNCENSRADEQDHNTSWAQADENPPFEQQKRQQFGIDKEEDILDLEDLGIIEVDDEEWNEYDVVDSDSSNKKKRIPSLKNKTNNISPQLFIRDKSPSTRLIRSKNSHTHGHNAAVSNRSGIPQKSVQSSASGLISQEEERERGGGNQQRPRSGADEEFSIEEESLTEQLDENNPRQVQVEHEWEVRNDGNEPLRIVDELELMNYLQATAALRRPQDQQVQQAQYQRLSDSEIDLRGKTLSSSSSSSSIHHPLNSSNQTKLNGKSEDFIYSDGAESDDQQEVFIKQQESLFREQRYRKQQHNQKRDVPTRPLSAKIKKSEECYPHPTKTNNYLTSPSFQVDKDRIVSAARVRQAEHQQKDIGVKNDEKGSVELKKHQFQPALFSGQNNQLQQMWSKVYAPNQRPISANSASLAGLNSAPLQSLGSQNEIEKQRKQLIEKDSCNEKQDQLEQKPVQQGDFYNHIDDGGPTGLNTSQGNQKNKKALSQERCYISPSKENREEEEGVVNLESPAPKDSNNNAFTPFSANMDEIYSRKTSPVQVQGLFRPQAVVVEKRKDSSTNANPINRLERSSDYYPLEEDSHIDNQEQELNVLEDEEQNNQVEDGEILDEEDQEEDDDVEEEEEQQEDEEDDDEDDEEEEGNNVQEELSEEGSGVRVIDEKRIDFRRIMSETTYKKPSTILGVNNQSGESNSLLAAQGSQTYIMNLTNKEVDREVSQSQIEHGNRTEEHQVSTFFGNPELYRPNYQPEDHFQSYASFQTFPVGKKCGDDSIGQNYMRNTSDINAFAKPSQLNQMQNGSTQRSKDKLLKKLMVRNIDFNDLKSVWKMSSEIKNSSSSNSSHQPNSAQNQLVHNNSHHSSSGMSAAHRPLPIFIQAQQLFQSGLNYEDQQQMLIREMELKNYYSAGGGGNSQTQKAQRSSSVGRSNTTRGLNVPISLTSSTTVGAASKSKKKKKTKKKLKVGLLKGNNLNDDYELNPVDTNSQRSFNSARPSQQLSQKKLGQERQLGQFDRSASNPDNFNACFDPQQKKVDSGQIGQVASCSSSSRESMASVRSPNRRELNTGGGGAVSKNPENQQATESSLRSKKKITNFVGNKINGSDQYSLQGQQRRDFRQQQLQGDDEDEEEKSSDPSHSHLL